MDHTETKGNTPGESGNPACRAIDDLEREAGISPVADVPGIMLDCLAYSQEELEPGGAAHDESRIRKFAVHHYRTSDLVLLGHFAALFDLPDDLRNSLKALKGLCNAGS